MKQFYDEGLPSERHDICPKKFSFTFLLLIKCKYKGSHSKCLHLQSQGMKLRSKLGDYSQKFCIVFLNIMTQGKKSATTGYAGRVATNITSAIRHDVDHFEILRFTSFSSQNDIKSRLKLQTHTDDARRSHDQRQTRPKCMT